MESKTNKPLLLHFSEAHFEKNLSALKNTQDSIQSLSSWCLQHKQHHKKIVNCWFKVMKKVKIESRLTLFYLANDVIQYSKRKNLDFVHTWALILQRAVTLVRDEKIKPNILRIFKIWSERGVFDEAFIADLTGLIESPKGVSSDHAKMIAEFQPMKLIDKIRSCKALEDDTDSKLTSIKDSPLELTDADALRNNLKDRRHGADLVTEVDDGIARMEAYVAALHEEIKDRAKLIDLLEQGSTFYDHQKGEAKIVVNAYRNFGSRVKNLKRKLDDHIPTLPSPVPSPDIDAPSPTPSDDLELPGDPSHGVASAAIGYAVPPAEPHMFMPSSDPSSLGMGSFMGSGRLPFDLKGNIFQDMNQEVHGRTMEDTTTSEGKPIEVIGGLRSSSATNSKPDEGFNINEFLKSLGHSDNAEPPAPNIPGLESGGVAPVPALRDVKPSQQYNMESFNSSMYNVFSAPPPPPPSNMVSSVPLQPPPAPPDMFLQESANSQQWGGYEDNHSSDLYHKLPSKFPTWNPDMNDSWEGENMGEVNKWDMGTSAKISKIDDTPMSPPMFEKEGFNEPVEYDDTSGTIAEDVDHRNVMIPHGRGAKKDVDHRNLISLTGSPASHQKHKLTWTKFDASASKDQDLRMVVPPVGRRSEVSDQDMRQPPIAATIVPLTPASPNPNDKTAGVFKDNVESVDMEMSDEESGPESQDSRKFDQLKKNQQLHTEKSYSKGSNQQRVVTASQNQPRSNHSNGASRNNPSKSSLDGTGPRPLMSPMKSPLPSLISGPVISPPRLPSPHGSKAPLLPTPPSLLHTTVPKPVLQHSSPLPSLLQEPSFLQEQRDQQLSGNTSKNGDDKNWATDEWPDQGDQKFVERMSESDSLEEMKNSNPIGRVDHDTPQSRGRRGSYMGGSKNYRGGKTPQSEFGGNSHASPGFPPRGFHGGGSYRPFRGARRGQFNRW